MCETQWRQNRRMLVIHFVVIVLSQELCWIHIVHFINIAWYVFGLFFDETLNEEEICSH